MTEKRRDITVQALIDQLENYYDFQCEGGPLRNCVEWRQLKARIADLERLLLDRV